MNISAIQSNAASLVRAADANPQVATSLLKKAITSDQNLVNTLLPPQGGLDIRA